MLAYTPSSLAVGSPPGLHSPQIVVMETHQPALHFYAVASEGSITETGVQKCTWPATSLACVDLNGDGTKEYVALSTDHSSFLVFQPSRGTWNERAFPVSASPQRFLIADINNDGRKDILLFGRKSTGIRTLLGRPKGMFTPGPLLFPDISVSDVKATDLNGDGITDLILLDWLSSQLMIFYGIGRGVFSEQITYDLPGEPENLAITSVSLSRSVDIAVTLPENRNILLLNCSPMGELNMTRTINCPDSPRSITYSLINDDPFPDIVAPTDHEVLVAMGNSMTDVNQPTVFGCASEVGSCLVADVDGDHKNDLVILDPTAQRLVVVGNASGRGIRLWPSDYSVGVHPRGLAIGDFNNDGLTDIAVANSGSMSVSILFNMGKGRIDGQQSIPVADAPFTLQPVANLPGHASALVASHPAAGKFSMLRIDEDSSHFSSFTVPTCTEPFTLCAVESAPKNGVEVFVRCTNRRDRSRSLSIFEQLAGNQFLERSVRLNLPYSITALTVDDFRQTGQQDLIFATHDRVSGKTTLSVALASSGVSYKNTQALFSFRDSTLSLRSIHTGYIDSDNMKDIVMMFGPPENMLGIAYGRGDGTCRDSITWVRGVRTLSEETIVIGDVDGNGTTDITYVDPVEKAVFTLFGRGNGKFSQPSRICRADGIQSLRVASIRVPHVQDLILSNEAKGIVSIEYNAFRK